MTEFQKVTVYTNWCHNDQLDGKDIVNGECVRVKWPDGSEELTSVYVRESSYQMSDMGSPCTIGERRAFIAVGYKGAWVEVFLRNTNVKLKRV